MSTAVAPGKLNKTESVFRFKKKKLAESRLCNQDPKVRSEKNKPVTQGNISRAQSRGPDVSRRLISIKREGGTMEPHYLIKMTINTINKQPIKYSNGLRRKV